MGPQDGESISVGGSTYRILEDGKDTAGAFATIDMLVPPGGGPGPHSHEDFDESFYVIECEVEVKSKFGRYVATKESFITIPEGGGVHGLKKKTGQATKSRNFTKPKGQSARF